MTNDELLDEIRKAHKPAPFAGLWLTNQQIDYLTRVAKKEAVDQAIRDAAGEAALALAALSVDLTPEDHNAVVDAILALLEKQ